MVWTKREATVAEYGGTGAGSTPGWGGAGTGGGGSPHMTDECPRCQVTCRARGGRTTCAWAVQLTFA